MSDAHNALHDPDRLAALRALDLLDTPDEEAFDRLTRLAARLLGVPVALVSLVDADRQAYKSRVLPPALVSLRESSLDYSFCQHTLDRRRPLILDDVRGHPLVGNNRSIAELGVAAYAGIPLVTPEGHALGTLCVLDTRPRVWTAAEVATLTDLAAAVMTEITLRALNATLERQVTARTAALTASLDLVRGAFDHAVVGMALLAPDGHWLQANAAFCALVGYTADELAALSFPALTHPDDRAEDLEYARQLLAGEITTYQMEKRYVHKDGHPVWAMVGASLVRDGTGQPQYFVAQILQDITARKVAEAALREREEYFRALVQHTTDVIIVADATTTLRYVSPSVAPMLGYRPADLVGTLGLDLVHPDDRGRAQAVLGNLLRTPGATTTLELHARHADGSARLIEATGTNLLDEPAVAGLVVSFRDLTERLRFTAQMLHQATHDPLTALPNRDLLLTRLTAALVPRPRQTGAMAVLFLDLDQFKVINDSLGHPVGDRLLVAIAKRLRRCLRTHDTLARFGGDEFMLLLPRVQDVDAAVRVTEQVGAALAAPFTIDGRTLVVSASIGVVVRVPAAQSATDLLRDADVAMYRAKAAGRGHVVVFDASMNAAALERLELEHDLRRALERDELRLVYQPKWDLATGRIVAFEALVRWQHPVRGLVLPDVFIPLAEATGLILPLGRWVLAAACRQMRDWRQQTPDAPLIVCVNLSAAEVRDPRLVADLAATLGEHGLASGCLELEITERVLLADAPATSETLRRLKALGVRLVIDDFGTGYSSLAYLKRFPVDALKIDRSFLVGLGHDAADTALVGGIVTLAHALGFAVTAEGVETAAQAAPLQALGCELGQGYYFARPLVPDAAWALLHAETHAGAPCPASPLVSAAGRAMSRTLRSVTRPMGVAVGCGASGAPSNACESRPVAILPQYRVKGSSEAADDIWMMV